MQFQIKVLILLFLPVVIYGQTSDTVNLETINVSSFYHNRPVLRLPASVAIVDSLTLHHFRGQSESAALNVIPGVRMEERSPGSYRLSIRGSLLRSPFGIRNVKIYLDEFPLTDAGGNTYLNLTDFSALSHIEILKGPDGSLYGTNSGGVLRLFSRSRGDSTLLFSGNAAYGSFGQLNQHIKVRIPIKNHIFLFDEALWTSNGYRQNSEFNRIYFRLADHWRYSLKNSLDFLMFVSDLVYQTPGGLTYNEWQTNPRSARPPTLVLPGAIQQRAGIENKTVYGGIKNELRINSYLKNTLSFFGSTINFQNRFITNIETRKEHNIGFRTVFEASNNRTGGIYLTFNTGLEGQKNVTDVANFGNNQGFKDTLQASAKLTADYIIAFARLNVDFFNKIILETSIGYNKNQYNFSRLVPENPEASTQFEPFVMPRFSLSWLINPGLAWRASLSRGYSPPSFNEVRPSDNRINLNLQPEHGLSYETGIRTTAFGNRLRWDVSYYYFPLQQSIVRMVNESGTEYFQNAGKVLQSGLESQTSVELLRTLQIQLQVLQNQTISRFRFKDYFSSDGINLTGHNVPGIPSVQVVTSTYLQLKSGINFYAKHNYSSGFSLNNENTVYTKPSHLVYTRIGYTKPSKQHIISFYLSLDNLLNTSYSHGYDLNAFGGRYYNPAPVRNITVGIMVR